MRAIRKHTDCPWVVLYIERWLAAPVQLPEGSLIEPEKGGPQGAGTETSLAVRAKRRLIPFAARGLLLQVAGLLSRRGGCTTRIAMGIRIERLGLEGEEKRLPGIARVFDEQCAILEHAVVTFPLAPVPLIHVNIMNPVTRDKMEVLVFLLGFRSPFVAERIDQARLVSR